MLVLQISHKLRFPLRYCGINLVIISSSLSVQAILLSYPCPSLGGRPNRQVSGVLSELSISASRALRIPTSVFQLCHESWLDKCPSFYPIPVHPSGAGPSLRALCRLKGLCIQMPRAPRSLSHVHHIVIER